jgi:two-component system, OmpR family, response regulator
MPKNGRLVRIFSALEVANICGVVNQTAINWIRNGHLKAFTTPGGQYRIYAKDLAAFLDKRGMSASGEVLQVIIENANWSVLLVAATQSLNDSLKDEVGSRFPDYRIIQAFDWFETGRKMVEEKPGFVLLDEGFLGVDISRFIQTIREDPVFGKPYIFLLTNGESSYEADLLLTLPLDFTKIEAVLRDVEKQNDILVNA